MIGILEHTFVCLGGGDCHCPQYRGLVANKEEIASDIFREDSVNLRISSLRVSTRKCIVFVFSLFALVFVFLLLV